MKSNIKKTQVTVVRKESRVLIINIKLDNKTMRYTYITV